MTETVAWLCTGSSRGIGLEVVKQLITNPAHVVIATCRAPEKATALQALKAEAKATLHILPLDISKRETIDSVLKPIEAILAGKGLDYLINGAAITEGDDNAFEFDYDGFMSSLQTNVVGPAYLSQVVYPLLDKGTKKTIVNYTSGLASIALDYGSKNATYSISKTAVNMLTYKQARQRPDFIVITVDPGWVKTDMGGPNAILYPSESVGGVLKIVGNLKASDSGKFFRYDGVVLPW